MTAKRLQNITESATLRISNLANELKSQGKDIISFSLGEPDFTTPSHIIDAAKASLERGETHYTPSPGIPELRKAIAEKLKKENKIETKPGNIIVTPAQSKPFLKLYSLFSGKEMKQFFLTLPGFPMIHAYSLQAQELSGLQLRKIMGFHPGISVNT